ncbi:hypothetical protein F444_06946 [Phytophthora nicotianae P1976]|uniref:Uncharacterized protein n=1 Tax=Phytophthora nicotianae P1976 TaxID=1317066 RepID=A0A081AGC5_PHYNI|nr:hypothetical protein F444_06946 [Phytophthora nicotianae P1976]
MMAQLPFYCDPAIKGRRTDVGEDEASPGCGGNKDADRSVYARTGISVVDGHPATDSEDE